MTSDVLLQCPRGDLLLLHRSAGASQPKACGGSRRLRQPGIFERGANGRRDICLSGLEASRPRIAWPGVAAAKNHSVRGVVERGEPSDGFRAAAIDADDERVAV